MLYSVRSWPPLELVVALAGVSFLTIIKCVLLCDFRVVIGTIAGFDDQARQHIALSVV